MLSNVKIGIRLAIGFAVMCLIMVVISGIAISSFLKINKKVDTITDDRWPKTVILNHINSNINIVARALRNAIIVSDSSDKKKELDRITSTLEITTKDLGELEKSITSNEGKLFLQVVKGKRAAYREVLKEVVGLIEENKNAEAGQLLLTKLRPVQTPFFESVEKMIEFQSKQLINAGDAVEETYKGAVQEIVAVLVASLLIAAMIGYFITRSITIPLQEAVKVNRAIANGDLSVPVLTARNDELGQLNESSHQMVQNLRSIVGNLSSTSSQVASAATQLNTNADQIATASEEVAAQAGTVATAGEEMAATSGDIAQSCNNAAEASQRASSVATAGADVVKKTVDVMEKIAEKVQLSARTVESLGVRSDQIGVIIGTIEDIADQTNLLALNAAIEAARAGEQGRGFAVVADEVRALAERTTKATKEISEMIKNIQNETKGAVGTMDEGVREVENGTTEAAKSGVALQEILDQINAVAMQVGQIATAAEEQTATTSEISNNIQQMSEVVQQTARGAQDSSQAAHALARLADDLNVIVGKFRMA